MVVFSFCRPGGFNVFFSGGVQDFNQSLNNITFPASLETLRFGESFNWPLDASQTAALSILKCSIFKCPFKIPMFTPYLCGYLLWAPWTFLSCGGELHKSIATICFNRFVYPSTSKSDGYWCKSDLLKRNRGLTFTFPRRRIWDHTPVCITNNYML